MMPSRRRPRAATALCAGLALSIPAAGAFSISSGIYTPRIDRFPVIARGLDGLSYLPSRDRCCNCGGSTRLCAEDSTEDVKQGEKKDKRRRRPKFRMQVFSFLNLPGVEVASTLAVLLSSLLVALDTLDYLPPIPAADIIGISSNPHVAIGVILDIFNIVFAVDFFFRWYAAGNFRAPYLRKPDTLVDIFVVLLPLFFSTVMPLLNQSAGPVASSAYSNPGLQNLLLLRVLRLRRILENKYTFSRFQKALGLGPQDVKSYQLQLARVLLSVFTLLSVASGLIYTAEHDVNPDFPNYFVALYFGLTTLTTVGFGDISPVTPEGRLVVCLSILAGVAIIPAQAGQLVESLVDYQNDTKKGGPRVTIRAKGGSVTVDPKPQKVLSAKTTPEEEETAIGREEFVGWLGRCCLECEATDHREDAKFCWSCGSKF